MRRVAAILLVLLCAGLAWSFLPASPSIPVDRPLPAPDRFRTAGPSLDIVVFGTSLSLGSWPDRLAETLETCLKREIRLTRLATAGAGSAQALDRLDRVLEADPDLVLMEFSINDADIRDGLWRDDSRSNHATLLEVLSLERPETQVILMTMSPAHGLRGILRPQLARYYRDYHDLAEAYDTGLADLYPRWRALPDWRAALPDGLHPTDDMAVNLIVPVLAGLVPGGDCPASGPSE